MRTLLGVLLTTGLLMFASSDVQGHSDFHFGYSSYGPGYYGFSPPTYYPPVYSPPIYSSPVYYGGWEPGWGSWAYPGRLGGYGYGYRFYTHLPGYSFSYYRGGVPRYYPGPFGPAGYGYYGYGPYGW